MINWQKELIDQPAHFLIAAGLTFYSDVNAWHGLILGLAMGLIREITEEGNPVAIPKITKAVCTSKLDISMWTLGGMIGGWLT